MQITISFGEDGKFLVDVSEGIPLFVAIGALEVAKGMLINGDITPTTKPEKEVIPVEVM